jgi:hypothetical protein
MWGERREGFAEAVIRAFALGLPTRLVNAERIHHKSQAAHGRRFRRGGGQHGIEQRQAYRDSGAAQQRPAGQLAFGQVHHHGSCSVSSERHASRDGGDQVLKR